MRRVSLARKRDDARFVLMAVEEEVVVLLQGVEHGRVFVSLEPVDGVVDECDANGGIAQSRAERVVLEITAEAELRLLFLTAARPRGVEPGDADTDGVSFGLAFFEVIECVGVDEALRVGRKVFVAAAGKECAVVVETAHVGFELWAAVAELVHEFFQRHGIQVCRDEVKRVRAVHVVVSGDYVDAAFVHRRMECLADILEEFMRDVELVGEPALGLSGVVSPRCVASEEDHVRPQAVLLRHVLDVGDEGVSNRL